MSGPVLRQELSFAPDNATAGSFAYLPASLNGQYVEFTVYYEFDADSTAGALQLETAFIPYPQVTYTGTWAAIGSPVAWADDTSQKYVSVTGVFQTLRVRISTTIATGTVRVYVVAASHAP